MHWATLPHRGERTLEHHMSNENRFAALSSQLPTVGSAFVNRALRLLPMYLFHVDSHSRHGKRLIMQRQCL